MLGENRVFWRRKAVMACAMMLLSCVAFADMNDGLIGFMISAADCYADGSPVAVGECYALVWSPKGTAFSGFNADGTTISPDDRVVMAAQLANGRNRMIQFQVPEAEYNELEDGEWALCLVDTRTADGKPAGVADNAPLRVNRWGTVDSEITAGNVNSLSKGAKSSTRGSSSVEILGESEQGKGERGACASALSAVPASVMPPEITKFEVSGGRAKITVTGTVPFLTYTLSAGDTPCTLTADAAADAVDGNPGAAIEIETDATEGCRFFRVTRAE